ncbi:MAG: hypothetical protein AB1568_06350 [Thermodesulfobacteriota bacterium]
MKLSQLAAIATIIGTIIVVIQFCSSDNGKTTISKVELPQILSQKKDDVEIDIKKEKYSGELNWLLAMYNAAKKMPYYNSQRDALVKVVNASIEVKDFNMAVIAAKDIPYYDGQRDALMKVVQAAIKEKEYYSYAVAAAEAIPYYNSQRDAYNLIVGAYEKEAMKSNQPNHLEKQQTNVTNKSVNTESTK